MTEDREGLIEHYRAMRADLAEALDGLSDELMQEPSLDGWSVKDHLAHLAFWDEIRSAEISRISAGQGSAWRMSEALDDRLNEVAYEIRRPMPLPDVLAELESTRRSLLAAIQSAEPRAFDPALYGSAGLRSGHAAEHAGWIRRWREGKGS